MRPWIWLTVILCAHLVQSALDPNDPIFSKVHINWDHKTQQLQIDKPEQLDCRSQCPTVDLCAWGQEMLECFDLNQDTYIDLSEMEYALGQLPAYKRMFTVSAEKWIAKFDGADSTIPDKKVGFREVIFSGGAHCRDFQLALEHFFTKCRQK
jgi:hypothetical protein